MGTAASVQEGSGSKYSVDDENAAEIGEEEINKISEELKSAKDKEKEESVLENKAKEKISVTAKEKEKMESNIANEALYGDDEESLSSVAPPKNPSVADSPTPSKHHATRSGDFTSSRDQSPAFHPSLNAFDSFSGGSNLEHILKSKKKQMKEEPMTSVEAGDDTDSNPMEILFQFIPYYGQGDAATDSTVRATLKNLLVDDIDFRDENGNTLLLLACQYVCEDLVRIMLNKGADPNAFNNSGACCLHFACYKDSASKAIAKALLQNGANPEVKEQRFGCTPLHYCASVGDLDFCKMLISYGGVVSTRDNYSYTCVDYAREAGHATIARYLQDSLLRSNIGSSRNLPSMSNQTKKDEWIAQQDPDSGAMYYYNSVTLECLWEEDYTARMSSQQSQTQQHVSVEDKLCVETKHSEMKGGDTPTNSGTSNPDLVAKTTRIRLQTFLEQNDIDRLKEVECLMEEYKGREKDLLRTLCKQYKVPQEKELEAFAETLSRLELRGSLGNTPIDLNNKSPLPPSPLAQAVAKRLSYSMSAGNTSSPVRRGSTDETEVLRAQLIEMKLMYETKLEEERARGQSAVSEREGSIAKLKAMLEAMTREKESAETENDTLQHRMENLTEEKSKSGTALEKELLALQTIVDTTTAELSQKDSLLAAEREKLRSLESSLAMVEASDQERMSAERKAADDRAADQRDRDKAHAEELLALQERSARATAKLRQELSEARADHERTDRELRVLHEEYRRNKELELDTLNKQMAEYKSNAAKELSAAQQSSEAAQRKMQEAEKQLVELQEVNQRLEDELNEARPLIALNAQLFRDLGREQLARKRLHNEMEDLKGKIRVYVRIRPMSTSEIERSCEEAVFKDGKISVMVKAVGGPDAKKIYDFDQIFGGTEGNSQEDVFRDTKHLVMSVIDGYNVCIFAYGQTGSGKTYTMMGSADIANCLSEDGKFAPSAGILPRAVSELFRLLKEREAQVEVTVEVQMFQLYRDALEDLLHGGMPVPGKKKKKGMDDDAQPALKIVLADHSQSGLVEVDGAEKILAATAAEVMRVVAFGSSRRTTASTQMNSESSRSHLICVLIVKLTNRRSKSVTVGKLTLVDLAGSERVDKSGATGEVLKEAQSINKSLSALGGVINAVSTGNNHIPYRDHALTMLMSDSIGGNAKTLMFVNCSPADYNNVESNNSLTFAARCKDIANSISTIVPGGGQQAVISALKREIVRLKRNEKEDNRNGKRTERQNSDSDVMSIS